jgi:folate-dependent phosphoribosylglycinamide formyltransferase PurN
MCVVVSGRPVMDLFLRNDIVMLAGENVTSWIVYNHLVAVFGPFPVLVERPLSRMALVRMRLRRLGLLRTLSQLAFVVLLRPVLRWRGKARIGEICRTMGLETAAPEAHYIRHIDSVNSSTCGAALAALKPKVVIVNGTRIIRKDILNATPTVFLNVHQGYTPQYRGSHGSYWALYNNDPGNCGVTVHIVDEGIDTGGVVARVPANPTATDNFATYPYLQTAAALPALVEATSAALAGTLRTITTDGPSAVWYHPGIFEYFRGWRRGVR